jgi:hypothetical protein
MLYHNNVYRANGILNYTLKGTCVFTVPYCSDDFDNL